MGSKDCYKGDILAVAVIHLFKYRNLVPKFMDILEQLKELAPWTYPEPTSEEEIRLAHTGETEELEKQLRRKAYRDYNRLRAVFWFDN